MKRRRRGHKKIILSSIPRKRFPTDLYLLNVFSLKEQWTHCFPATTECVFIFVVALKIQNFMWFALQDHHRITIGIVKTTNAIMIIISSVVNLSHIMHTSCMAIFHHHHKNKLLVAGLFQKISSVLYCKYMHISCITIFHPHKKSYAE